MKKSTWALFSLIMICLIFSCQKEEKSDQIKPVLNDYLPLKVGTKYRYKYENSSGSVEYSYNGSGEVAWKFISVSVDTPYVYTVEQTQNGSTIHEQYYPPKKDTTRYVNVVTTFTFKVLKNNKVQWGDYTLERFIESDRNDTCFHPVITEGVCLRKNVGITHSYSFRSGNHPSSGSLSLLEGPYN